MALTVGGLMFSLPGLIFVLLLFLEVAVVLGLALLFVRLATRIVRREWDRAGTHSGPTK